MTKQKMKHLLLTRFNVNTYGKSDGVRRGLQPDYLEYRFKLFEQFCLPSIEAQKVNFDWLVFFSKYTPEPFLERIAGYRRHFAKFIPIFVDDPESFDVSGGDGDLLWKGVLDHLRGTEYDYLITSRVDNDDALGCDFMAHVQRQVYATLEKEKLHKFLVVLLSGNILHLQSSFTQDYKWNRNHYPTLVVPRNDLDYILRVAHDRIEEYGVPIKVVGGDHSWLEVVNGTNLCNDLRLDCKPNFISSKKFKEWFNIDVEVLEDDYKKFLKGTFIPQKRAALRELITHKIKKIFGLISNIR